MRRALMPSVRAPLSLLAKSNNQPFCFRFLSLLLNVTVALFLDRVRFPEAAGKRVRYQFSESNSQLSSESSPSPAYRRRK